MSDPDFRFPQTWRTNIGVDRKLPWGMIGTAEYIYNRDVNGVDYFNANLPAAQTTFVGADNRPRWVGTSCATPTPVRVSRASTTRKVTSSPARSSSRIRTSDARGTAAASLAKTLDAGFAFKGPTATASRATRSMPARLPPDRSPPTRSAAIPTTPRWRIRALHLVTACSSRARTPGTTSASAARRCQPTGKHAPSATPATSSRAT